MIIIVQVESSFVSSISHSRKRNKPQINIATFDALEILQAECTTVAPFFINYYFQLQFWSFVQIILLAI